MEIRERDARNRWRWILESGPLGHVLVGDSNDEDALARVSSADATRDVSVTADGVGDLKSLCSELRFDSIVVSGEGFGGSDRGDVLMRLWMLCHPETSIWVTFAGDGHGARAPAPRALRPYFDISAELWQDSAVTYKLRPKSADDLLIALEIPNAPVALIAEGGDGPGGEITRRIVDAAEKLNARGEPCVLLADCPEHFRSRVGCPVLYAPVPNVREAGQPVLRGDIEITAGMLSLLRPHAILSPGPANFGAAFFAAGLGVPHVTDVDATAGSSGAESGDDRRGSIAVIVPTDLASRSMMHAMLASMTTTLSTVADVHLVLVAYEPLRVELEAIAQPYLSRLASFAIEITPPDEPFRFAAAANRGQASPAAAASDFLLIGGDDFQFPALGAFRIAGWMRRRDEFLIGAVSNWGGGADQTTETSYSEYAPLPDETTERSRYRLCGFCLGMPTRTFERIGGYDDIFVGYGSDDTDLCLRAALAGLPLEVDRECFIFHEGSRTFKARNEPEHLAAGQREAVRTFLSRHPYLPEYKIPLDIEEAREWHRRYNEK